MDSVKLRWSPDDVPGSKRKDWSEAVHAALLDVPGTLMVWLAKGAHGWRLESLEWGLGTRDSFKVQTDPQERELAGIVARALWEIGQEVTVAPRLAAVPCFSNNVPHPAERSRWDDAVQAGLQGRIGKVVDYSVIATQSSGNVDVKLTLPGDPPVYRVMTFRDSDQASETIREGVDSMVADL